MVSSNYSNTYRLWSLDSGDAVFNSEEKAKSEKRTQNVWDSKQEESSFISRPDKDLQPDLEEEKEDHFLSFIDFKKIEMKFNPNEFPNVQIQQQVYHLFVKYLPFICKITTPKGNGTGCLIGAGLILTNYHVFTKERDLKKEVVGKSQAIFFNVQTGEDPLEPLDLDPNDYIYSPDNPGQLADEEHLDYVIVGIKSPLPPHLLHRFSKGFKLFDTPPSLEETQEKLERAIVLGCPSIRKPNYIACTAGIFGKTDDLSIHYNALTAGGNSGGAVLDLLRDRFKALHYKGGIPCTCISNCLHCNAGILSLEIVKKAHPIAQRLIAEEKEAQKNKKLAIQNLPSAYLPFFGREQDLSRINKALENQTRIVLEGPAGIGKTALAVEYVFQYRYRFTRCYFIRASCREQLIQDLLYLANNDLHLGFVEKNRGMSDQVILDKLRNYIESQPPEQLALIFGNIYHPEVDQELNLLMPKTGSTLFFARSYSSGSSEPLPITFLERGDAFNFITQITPIKEEEKETLLKWAEKLKFHPIALRLAAQFISLNMSASILQCSVDYDKVRASYPGLQEQNDFKLPVLKMWKLLINKTSNQEQINVICQILSFFDPFCIPSHILNLNFSDLQNDPPTKMKQELLNLSFIIEENEHNFSCCPLLMDVVNADQTNSHKKGNFAKAIELLYQLVRQFDYERVETWEAMKMLAPHCRRILTLSKEPSDTPGFFSITTYRQLLFLHIQFGNYYLHVLTNFVQAKNEYQEAISVCQSQQSQIDKHLLALAYHKRGHIAHETDKTDEALIYYNLAKQEYQQIQSIEGFFFRLDYIILMLEKDDDLQETYVALCQVAQDIYSYTYNQKDNLHLSYLMLSQEFSIENFSELIKQLITSVSKEEQGLRRKKRLIQICAKCLRELTKIKWDTLPHEKKSLSELLEFEERLYVLKDLQHKFYGVNYHPDLIRTQQYIADIHIEIASLIPELKKGCLRVAYKIFKCILNDQYSLYLTDRNSEIAIVLAIQGRIKFFQNDFLQSLVLGVKALNMKLEFLPDKHSEIAYSYFFLGEAYEKVQDISQAVSHYDAFLRIEEECLDVNQGKNFRYLPKLRAKVEQRIEFLQT